MGWSRRTRRCHLLPGDQAAQVVIGWRNLLSDVPDELSTFVSFATAPPAPFIPVIWHNKKVVAVIACCVGDPFVATFFEVPEGDAPITIPADGPADCKIPTN